MKSESNNSPLLKFKERQEERKTKARLKTISFLALKIILVIGVIFLLII